MVGSDAVIGLPDDASVLEHEMPAQVGICVPISRRSIIGVIGVLYSRFSYLVILLAIVCRLCRSFVRLVVRSSNIGM